MSPENFVKAQVAAFIHAEAHHLGGVDGMLAVACVLRNRVKAGWQGGDWLKIINAAQDAAALTPPPPHPIELSSATFRRVLQEIDDIFLGIFTDTLTGGGLYYMDLLHAEQGQTIRPWFAEKIMRDQENHRRVAQVGMIQIYA